MNCAFGSSVICRSRIPNLFRQHHNASPFGCFIGQRGKLRGIGQIPFRDARGGQELGGLAVAQRDRACLIQQHHVHVSRRFDRPSAHGQHIVLEQAIHARNPNGAQ